MTGSGLPLGRMVVATSETGRRDLSCSSVRRLLLQRVVRAWVLAYSPASACDVIIVCQDNYFEFPRLLRLHVHLQSVSSEPEI